MTMRRGTTVLLVALASAAVLGGCAAETPGATESPSAPATPSSDPAPTCASLDGEAAVAEAIPLLPAPFDDPAMSLIEWDAEQATVDTYDPCAELSWIVVPISGGSVSSPNQIALFHRGEYIGPATERSYGFRPDVVRVDDASIEVTYRWAESGDANAEPSGTTVVSFAWDEASESVVFSGELPPE
ncbi:LppP/LprE family lipoprotein [Microbacterium betulae]|uniref:LppP/LprE family lipoprotein n=1 Tax=Microbacterium betulae TaxID=2981139 RepID=A0AA97FGG2_9MICO|nr:LppP/LprE family lipoprotein [Microbacterium sp. AB]WOF22438.1 LppP/LprE family lipoprotein [Microbacterium sp. AB]